MFNRTNFNDVYDILLSSTDSLATVLNARQLLDAAQQRDAPELPAAPAMQQLPIASKGASPKVPVRNLPSTSVQREEIPVPASSKNKPSIATECNLDVLCDEKSDESSGSDQSDTESVPACKYNKTNLFVFW